MADEDQNEQPPADEEAEKPVVQKKDGEKSGMLIIIIISFLVMTITPVICFIIVKKAIPATVETTQVSTDLDETILELESIQVNIMGTKGTRVIQVQPHLIFSEVRLKEDLDPLKPMIIDRILMVTSRMTIDDLEGAKGQEMLKRDIIGEVNSAIKEKMKGSLIKVYFKSFLIQ